jgi:UDP-N-acetylglucosamine--N-acetylmuramyl-(pentapeptide) pyrophosphoryl-undecaprenol N-acetylglucosamine transferase
MTPDPEPLHVVLAGGGSAGHVEPALALADALVRHDPATDVTALGTERGLETRLVPARGYELELIPAVPVPRRPSVDLLTLPARVRQAVRAVEAVLDNRKADVLVGFGGYVSAPAYLAAVRRGVPYVVHEGNARPGWANRLGARRARYVASASASCTLRGARLVGMPMRLDISSLDRTALRASARARFGLDEDGPVLLVTGGSQGASRINAAVSGAAQRLLDSGVRILHIVGTRTPMTADGPPGYVQVGFCDRMDLAYAAADFVLCRAGGMTVAELTAVGLGAAYVPLPIGNGEQRLNALPVVAAGGGVLVDDERCTPEWVAGSVLGIVADPDRTTAMAEAAARLGRRDGDVRLAALVRSAARERAGS